jgi:hypothetical protein
MWSKVVKKDQKWSKVVKNEWRKNKIHGGKQRRLPLRVIDRGWAED